MKTFPWNLTRLRVLEDNDHERKTAGYLHSGCSRELPSSAAQPRYFGPPTSIVLTELTFLFFFCTVKLRCFHHFLMAGNKTRLFRRANVKQRYNPRLNANLFYFRLCSFLFCLSLKTIQVDFERLPPPCVVIGMKNVLGSTTTTHAAFLWHFLLNHIEKAEYQNVFIFVSLLQERSTWCPPPD